MRLVRIAVPALLAFTTAQPALSQSNGAKPRDDLPKVVGDVIDCQTLTDQTARLACFDRTVAALDSAHRGRDVLIADREQMKQTRRGLFGLNLPAVRLFGGGDDKAGTDEEDIQEIESVVQSARLAGGKWSFTIEDGAQWVQVDDMRLVQPPQPGKSRIAIRRAALGSFLAKVDGQRALRVKRVVQ